MELTDKQFARDFADEHRTRLSWRATRAPGGDYHWHWKLPPMENWISDAPSCAIAAQLVREYATKYDVTMYSDRVDLILKLAQRLLLSRD